MQSMLWLEVSYLTAAKRHAGGTATAKRAEMVRRARKTVDLAPNILEDGTGDVFENFLDELKIEKVTSV